MKPPTKKQQEAKLKALRHRRARLMYWLGDRRTSEKRYLAMREELRQPELDLREDETCNTCGGNYYGHDWIVDEEGRAWAVAEIRDYQCRYCRTHENHGLKAGPHPSLFETQTITSHV